MTTGALAELIGALRFRGAKLPDWSEAQWRAALPLCDRAQLTLPLADAWLTSLPGEIRQRLTRDLENTAVRQRRVRAEYEAIAQGFTARGLPFVVLKGFSGDGDFFACAYRRTQYDLDFLLDRDNVVAARDALVELGYHALQSMEEFPTDHLPVMVPKTGWQWRGDFFDRDIPLSVDLHFRLWDDSTERFPAPGWEQFFERHVTKNWNGLAYPALALSDALTYHCLHLLRHLLRGSLRIAHVHELGYFLESHAEAHGFWGEWETLYSDQARRLQAICFALAERWFVCSLAPTAQEAVDELPEEIQGWIARYGDSPIEALTHPNKNEMWLHLALLESWQDRRTVLRRRLLPARVPRYLDTAYVPDGEITARHRWMSRLRRVRHVGERIVHHGRALPGVMWHGSRWAWGHSHSGRLGAPYWRFLAAATFFNLGSFVFLVLYNLYLSDLGYREDTLGRIGSAMTLGSIAGTLPAGMLLRRMGARWMLAACFVGVAVCSVGRILFPAPGPLIAFAFLSGAAFAQFAVTVAPTIAQLSTERTRPRAFSFFFAVGIGLGIVGGQLAGRLPAVLGSKRAALLTACVLIGAAAIPALTLRMAAPPPSPQRTYPTGPFIRRFLTAIAIWSMAAGAFSPFFNVFFAQRMHAAVEQVGNIYSMGQAAQVAAILLAPHVLARLGLNQGVAVSQLCCGLALLALAMTAGAGIWTAGVCYAAYIGFHYMGEPGLFSLLMNHAAPEQRSGASALNFLATFAGQAVAVAIAGVVVTRSGYTPVFLAAAALSALAALLVWRLDHTSQ